MAKVVDTDKVTCMQEYQEGDEAVETGTLSYTEDYTMFMVRASALQNVTLSNRQ